MQRVNNLKFAFMITRKIILGILFFGLVDNCLSQETKPSNAETQHWIESKFKSYFSGVIIPFGDGGQLGNDHDNKIAFFDISTDNCTMIISTIETKTDPYTQKELRANVIVYIPVYDIDVKQFFGLNGIGNIKTTDKTIKYVFGDCYENSCCSDYSNKTGYANEFAFSLDWDREPNLAERMKKALTDLINHCPKPVSKEAY
jgi:hypothetical protein